MADQHDLESDVFVLPKVGFFGRRRMDRVFMDSVNCRAKRLRQVTRISCPAPSIEDADPGENKQGKLF